jgi:putative ABC transport system substrate-binding protein
MTNRRTFLVAATAVLFGSAVPSGAQTSGRVQRIFLHIASRQGRDWLSAGLRELGWIEGQNVVLQWHSAEADETLRAEIQEVIQRPVDILVLPGALRIRAAMSVTETVPIVTIDLESDPVASGFVKSLARPGRNVSGIWMDLPELAGKQVELIREVMPSLTRLGVLWDDRFGKPQFAETEAAARVSKIGLASVTVRNAADADDAVRRVFGERAQPMLVLTSPPIFNAQARIAELARKHKLPSISPFSTYPAAGGLMAYGPDFPAIWRQAASYVDRILKGAKVGDLPVERPAKFTLVINLKTARALGVTIPPSLLQRADQVIE